MTPFFPFSPHQEHSIFMDSVRRFVTAEFAPHIKQWEQEGRFPNEVFQKLGSQGFLGILLSEENGGIGGDYELAAAWCEAFGELCDLGLGTGVNMHSLVITPAIERFGTPETIQRWVPAAARGEKIGAYAFTEPDAGSDLANLRTKAVWNGSHWVLNGSKIFITNGARADFVLVLARTNLEAGHQGFTTFVVDAQAPGFAVRRTLDKLGWRSSDTAELTFENVLLSKKDILGTVGDGWIQASNNLNWERMMLTLTTLSGTRQCIQQAVQYCKDRVAFGKPIFELPGVFSLIQEMHERFFLAEALTYRALKLFLAKESCRAEVSIAKRQVCEDALWIADKAIQLHGGYGYTTEFLPERWWRELRLMTLGGGTSEIMGNIVIKELGV